MLRLPAILFTFGCLLSLIGFICKWLIIPLIFGSNFMNEIILSNGTGRWEEWTNTNNEGSYLKFYIFNVTNPKEIESGANPVVKEVGPYVYKENRIKRIIAANFENDTLKYAETVFYHFNKEMSSGNEDDIITVINVPFVAAAEYIFAISANWFGSIYLSKFQMTVFVNRTVKEFLFDGTYEPIINKLHNTTGLQLLPNSTFGILYGKNGTEQGEKEIFSGIRNFFTVGRILTWEGKQELDYWPSGTPCNMINGSDGSLFSPFTTKETKLEVFNEDLCRSFYLTYKSDVEFQGIYGYRFAMPAKLFESPTENSDNRCFCLEEDMNNCPKNGVYEISSCRNKAPIFVSFPHFLYGDLEYIEKFGFRPQSELHESRVDVEPTTGTPLEIHKRIQINVDVKKLQKNYKYKKIQNMIFPLIWMDEVYVMPETTAARIRFGLFTSIEIMYILTWIAFVLSILLIFTSIIIYWIRRRTRKVFV